MRKIAVVGAGYAGLAITWFLLQQNHHSVTLFEQNSLGQNASGVSTGLLHPYLGKKALRSHRADEAMASSKELLQVAQAALGAPVALQTGVLRLAMNKEQITTFLTPPPDAFHWPAKKVTEELPEALPTDGLWIPGGCTVFSRRYVEGLWLACEQKGARWIKATVPSLDTLDQYDAVIVTSGHEVMRFSECRDLPLRTRKGQALVCRIPPRCKLPTMSIIGEGHLTLTEHPEQCLLGATYETKFQEEEALGLKGKIGAFYPSANDFEVLEIRQGARIAPKMGYLPLVEQISPRCHVFTGLGSRGLLYHALYAKELAQYFL